MKNLLVLGADQSNDLQYRVKIVKFEKDYVSVSFLDPDAENDYSIGDTEVMRLSRRQAGQFLKALDEWLDE